MYTCYIPHILTYLLDFKESQIVKGETRHKQYPKLKSFSELHIHFSIDLLKQISKYLNVQKYVIKFLQPNLLRFKNITYGTVIFLSLDIHQQHLHLARQFEIRKSSNRADQCPKKISPNLKSHYSSLYYNMCKKSHYFKEIAPIIV